MTLDIHGYPLIEECAVLVANVLVAMVRAGHMKRVTALDISRTVHELRVGGEPIRVGWARVAIEQRAWDRVQAKLG